MSSASDEHVFIGPGLSPLKRFVTIIGLIALITVVLWIAVYQQRVRNDVSAMGSTIAALLFIAGFIYYLSLVAPVSFTITVSAWGVSKRSRKNEIIDLAWDDLTRIKEEFFPNGKRISVIVYRKVTTANQKAKAWAVYRDDVTDLDALAETLRQMLPATCQWERETVHE